MLEGWVARAAERASDYELVRWDGACPDEYVDAFVAEQDVMNTAPIEDLEFEDEVFTVARLRDREASVAIRNIELVDAGRRSHADGRDGGAHRRVAAAALADQGVPERHRRKPGASREGPRPLAQGADAVNLMDERPQIDNISTWNAGSNEAMLGINYAMGFKTVTEFGEHQVRADVALEKLAAILA